MTAIVVVGSLNMDFVVQVERLAGCRVKPYWVASFR